MTHQEIAAIVLRHPGDRDIAALDAEIHRLADKLTDCWLLLDDIARHAVSERARVAAQLLLRNQGVPGWKENGR